MTEHVSVLLQESIEYLDPKEGETVVDGTLGSGGHARLLRDRAGTQGLIVGIDADSDAIERARQVLSGPGARVELVCDNFRNIDMILKRLGIQSIDRLMLDLGLSSVQIEDSGRGFSFQKDEPLAMTLAKERNGGVTARDVVNEWQEDTLADIIYGFGEERFAKRIARAITEARQTAPIETTSALVNIIEHAVPAWYRHRKTHCATKTFQAIRIATNDEMGALREGVEKGFALLSPGGRMAVITFHSLEDRFVKRFFNACKKEGTADIITKRPIAPSSEEVARNRRARSAKLRVIKKI